MTVSTPSVPMVLILEKAIAVIPAYFRGKMRKKILIIASSIIVLLSIFFLFFYTTIYLGDEFKICTYQIGRIEKSRDFFKLSKVNLPKCPKDMFCATSINNPPQWNLHANGKKYTSKNNIIHPYPVPYLVQLKVVDSKHCATYTIRKP
jgi:hypothetical protein